MSLRTHILIPAYKLFTSPEEASVKKALKRNMKQFNQDHDSFVYITFSTFFLLSVSQTNYEK